MAFRDQQRTYNAFFIVQNQWPSVTLPASLACVSATRRRDHGQNVTSIEVATSVCRDAEMTGKSHFSYCTEPETLKVEFSHTDARAPQSVIVPPLGMNPLLTFSCRKLNCRLSLGVNQ